MSDDFDAEDIKLALLIAATDFDDVDTESLPYQAKQLIEAYEQRIAELELIREAMCHELDEAEQVLGKVLGYPWYKDDQKNFPGATEEDGVCIGEHVLGTIASEAADQILKLESENAELKQRLQNWNCGANSCTVYRLEEEVKELKRQLEERNEHTQRMP